MKRMQWMLGALMFVGALLAVSYWRRGTAPHSLVPGEAVTDLDAPTQIEDSVKGLWEEGIVSWRQADFVQEYKVFSGGDFVVVDESLDGITGQWGKTSYASNVTFDPFVFGSAGRDYFAIGGIDHSTGDTAIERWKLVSKVAIPGTPPTKTFLRTQIYRGSLAQPPVALGIDPDKRFMVLLCDDEASRQLYQIPMQANATPVLLYDAASQPVLSQAWMVNPLQHVSLGRIWLVSGMTSTFTGETMVLVDSNNDGVFEHPPIVDTHANLVASGLLEASQIIDSFVGG